MTLRQSALLFSFLVAGGSLPAAATVPSAPRNLSAPALARTATTALLLWDRPAEAAGVTSYQIFCDHQLVGETPRLSFTARNLAPGKSYEFTVRSWRAPGVAWPASSPVTVTTKPVGAVLNVRERGARGDGTTVDTEVIQQTIRDCPVGGTVVVPPGVYLVDHLELKSDLTFALAEGATLQFRGRSGGRFPSSTVRLPGPDGEVEQGCFALISAVGAQRLTITGAGTIHGNGETWWPHREFPRPRLLQLIQCNDVLVQGITLDDPPAWNTHAIYVDRAVFSDLTFRKVSRAPGTNGDGLNPDSCRDVLIVGCRFGNQDDSIALKAGRVSPETPRRKRSCENITIRDCLFDGSLAPGAHPLGFAVGSETSGGIRHVLLRDCEFRNAASLANLKANRERAYAVVEDIRIENCTYLNTSWADKPYNRAPITIDLFYYRDFGTPDVAAPLKPTTPVFRDIHFRNIVIENPKGRFAYLAGLIERPVQDVTFENVSGSARTGLHGQNLDGVSLRNVTITAAEGPPATWINVSRRTEASEGGPAGLGAR